MHPSFVEFLLPVLTLDSGAPPVSTLSFHNLGTPSVKGIVRCWLRRCPGPFGLLCLKWGGMSLGQCLTMVQLALTI